jgi:hypothetical protein
MESPASSSEIEQPLSRLEARRSLASVPLLASTVRDQVPGIAEVPAVAGRQILFEGCAIVQTVSANSRARAIFDIDGEFCRFESQVAISEGVSSKGDFMVFTDGREVAAVRGVRAGVPHMLAAELGRARVMELRVQTNQVASCHAMWTDTMLEPNPIPNGQVVSSNGRTLPGEYRLPENRMTELEALAIGLNTDKGTDHSYLPWYSGLLDGFRKRLNAGEDISLLEIGVRGGGSIHLWRDYFGQRLRLHCIDLNMPGDLPRGTSLHLGSACDEVFLRSHLAGFSFDIIIDDGSHEVEEQIRTFLLLKPLLKPGGVFIIEDIQSLSFVGRIESGTATNFEILDLREKKNRWDDVLLVYTDARPRARRAQQRDRKLRGQGSPKP